uniref:Uncharacterized protein n=1 Tax=Anguilla anguilla TaxID=7936 RepID=A0A0E9TPS9_ANGAN
MHTKDGIMTLIKK